MRIWKFPDQAVKLAILLAIATAALVVVRARFVPPSFGRLGHYRAEAVEAVRSMEVRYAGQPTCVECHDTEGEIKSGSYHRSVSCEVCHGPAAGHAADPGSSLPAVPSGRGMVCLNCHEYLASRPTGFPQIIERLHNPLQPCTGCHNPHDPTPPEVPGSCSACHAQIARTKAISHHMNLACETCHEASPEHRQNPRAFLPKKPTSREFCGRCHGLDAHGLPEAPRVDVATHGGRYLCWQCHYPHYPEG